MINCEDLKVNNFENVIDLSFLIIILISNSLVFYYYYYCLWYHDVHLAVLICKHQVFKYYLRVFKYLCQYLVIQILNFVEYLAKYSNTKHISYNTAPNSLTNIQT